MDIKSVIVIGASAGGINAINQLAEKLPADLPVAIFIVIHMSRQSQAEIISSQLQKHTSYTCLVAKDGDQFKAGHIYIAPADKHLLLKPGIIKLLHGPHENRWRPSIDVLFRSAAAAYDSHVIGIILSGMLDDGASGMSAIKRSGGVCIVQEPTEAEYMDMPLNTLNNVDVDHRVYIEDMGYIIADELSKPRVTVQIPEDVKIESEITERMVSKITEMEQIGTHSNFTCPDCGGNLWRINNENFARYRCHTGHVYNESVLLEKQSEQMEESIWISIRMLEERRNLLLTIISRGENNVDSSLLTDYRTRAEELAVHIERLKSLLISMNKNGQIENGRL